MRDDWQPGDAAWFEYHCQESDDSSDAELWHRSHQQVTVTGPLETDPAAEGMSSYDERCEASLIGVYPVLFADGHQGHAWEDELLTGPEHYVRPDPPLVPVQLDFPAAGPLPPAGRTAGAGSQEAARGGIAAQPGKAPGP
jgi:hypothetical protein